MESISVNSAAEGNIQKRYDKLAMGERQHFLDRARDASKLTIPSMIRENWEGATDDLDQPYQSVGGRGIQNLSSKLLLALFPPTTPFFRLLVSESDLKEIPEDQRDLIRGEIEDSLAEIEQAIFEKIEASTFRVTVMEALKHLVVAGNAIFYIGAKNEFRTYSLEDYTVARDMEGNLLEIIVRERVAKEVAAEYTLNQKADDLLPSADSSLPSTKIDHCVMFTSCRRNKSGKFDIVQEISGKPVAVVKDVAEEDLPYLVIRLTASTGEAYGRGYVEHLIGDLLSLESLSQSIVQAAALASKVTYFVRPGSLVRPKALAESENGAVLAGEAADVTVLQAQKGNDLNTVNAIAQQLEQRLGLAFLLFENAVRDSERTTAFEVQSLVQSLEQVLAGVYAVMNQTLVRPFLNVMIKRMTEDGEIPKLPDAVKLVISTGLTNLGRISELERLTQFYQMAVQFFGPELAMQHIDPTELINRMATSIGIEKKGLVKSRQQIEEEKAAQQEALMQQQAQEQMQQLAVNAGNSMINAAADPEQSALMEERLAEMQQQIAEPQV